MLTITFKGIEFDVNYLPEERSTSFNPGADEELEIVTARDDVTNHPVNWDIIETYEKYFSKELLEAARKEYEEIKIMKEVENVESTLF